MDHHFRLSGRGNHLRLIGRQIRIEARDDLRKFRFREELRLLNIRNHRSHRLHILNCGGNHVSDAAFGQDFMNAGGNGIVLVVDDDGARLNLFIPAEHGSRLEGDVRSQHLFHQERNRNRLQHVVDGGFHIVVVGIRLGDQIGELSVRFPGAVARGASDDLNDFGKRRAVADGQNMLAPRPVEAFLRHAERNNDVHLRGIFDVSEIFEDIHALCIVRHEIGNKDLLPLASSDRIDPRIRVLGHYGADGVENAVDLIKLHPGRFHRIDVGNMNNRLLIRIQDFLERIKVAPLIEVVSDAERLQVLVAVQLFVIGIRDLRELGLIFGLHDGHRISAEIRARHRHDMGGGIIHQIIDDPAENVPLFR